MCHLLWRAAKNSPIGLSSPESEASAKDSLKGLSPAGAPDAPTGVSLVPSEPATALTQLQQEVQMLQQRDKENQQAKNQREKENLAKNQRDEENRADTAVKKRKSPNPKPQPAEGPKAATDKENQSRQPTKRPKAGPTSKICLERTRFQIMCRTGLQGLLYYILMLLCFRYSCIKS